MFKRRTSLLATAALFASTLLPFSPAAAQTAAGDIFISEFHYDNDGTDVGEFVEVTAPAGTDLTGFVVQPRNGSGGAAYSPATLSGIVADQGGGYGTATVDIAGLQNGAPDGIALLDASGALLEFLSYEGEFAGVGGAADGIPSTDVDVAQGAATLIGGSIERTGTVPGSWQWVSTDTNTKGALNDGLVISDDTGNAPVVPVCEDVTILEGSGDTVGQSASDSDGNVVSAAITSGDIAGITLENPTPGTVLTVDLVVADSLTVGSYDLVLTFTNDDDPDAQTASCDVNVTVQGDLCEIPIEDLTPINVVQGSGAVSPIEGTEVTVEGVVVGDFQNNGQDDDGDLNGFFIQSLAPDGDPETSEGVFVYAPGSDDVTTGDVVRVAGTVDEFGGSTQIADVSQLVACGADELPAATEIILPVDSVDEYERYESMYITFPQDLAISEYFNYARYGEVVLSLPFDGQDRLYTPTAVVEPGTDAAQLLEDVELRRITLDDGLTTQNPNVVRHPNGDAFTLDNRFRGGDTVTDATGVLNFSFDKWRIQPTEGADYTATNPRLDSPADVGGDLTVASFNVLNYFLTIDTGSDECGANAEQECRGADDLEEFERQRTKILAALAALDADVIGLIEMENTPGVEPLADIVEGLNQLGVGTYAYVDTGVVGTDAIRNGFIYRTGSVDVVGEPAILDSTVGDERFDVDRNRPTIAQTFVEVGTDERFTVAVNHLKSKGSACTEDPDIADGQGNCSTVRTEAAAAMVDWLAGDPTESGDEDVLIIGDLNAYDLEDAIDAVLEGPDDTLGTDDDYVDLVRKYLGEFAYGYVFDGLFGYLDHALANSSMAEQVTGTTIWHINADEPGLLDYDTSFKPEGQEALYEDNAFRSSDHDPVLVGLDLGPAEEPNTAPTVEDLLLTTEEDTSVDGQLVLDDADGHTLTVSYGDPGSGSVAVVDFDGAFTYTPDPEFTGTDTFEVTVSDGIAEVTATVTVTVTEKETEEPPVEGPQTKDDCKAGGWRDLGYRNQGQCVADVASDGRSGGPSDGTARGRSIPRGVR